jgi:hypothetical protein
VRGDRRRRVLDADRDLRDGPDRAAVGRVARDDELRTERDDRAVAVEDDDGRVVAEARIELAERDRDRLGQLAGDVDRDVQASLFNT